MRVKVLTGRVQALAAGLAIVAGCLTLSAGTAVAAPTCPAVDPGTGAVTPPPSTNADWSGCDLSGAHLFLAKMVNMDLSGANLSDANLMVATISGGTMANANLTGANISSATVSANLTDANFTDANLANTNLTAATVTGANMGTATITGIKTFNTKGVPASLPAGWEDIKGTILGATADAADVILTGTNLAGLDLDQVILTGADLNGANLSNTDLGQATLGGVQSGGITAPTTPSLPVGWQLTDGYLIGNGANLNGANLPGINLAGLDFSSTNLSAANLTGATLTGTDFNSANLFQTNFTNADLTGASAKSATLTSANLSGATTTGLNLTDANLMGATLGTGTDFSGATLTGIESGSVTGTTPGLPANWALFNGYLVGPSANLTSADLTGLSLATANLSGANLSLAVLHGASLPSANLTSVNMSGADLTNADVSNANLTSASLKNANLTGASLDSATVTSTDFTGVTWSDTTCPDGSNSDAYNSGCFSALDTMPPVPDPFLLSDGTEVNGWFNAPVTVGWGWTDTGTLSPTACPRFSTTTTNGPITLDTSCADIAGNTATDSLSLQVDATTPIVKVTGVHNNDMQRYVVGQGPVPGCNTTETISGVQTPATLSVTGGRSGGVGPFTATCAGAVSVAGLAQAAPVRVKYTIGYGFGGFIGPRQGSTIARSSGLAATFRLVTSSGAAIASSTAHNLAFARDVRLVLQGPGIKPVSAYCHWISQSREFSCPITIPAKVRTGHANSYTITAQENLGTGMYDVPVVGHASNPEILHFS